MRHERLQVGRDGVVKVSSWSETWTDSCCCRHMAKGLGAKEVCSPLIERKGVMWCETERKGKMTKENEQRQPTDRNNRQTAPLLKTRPWIRFTTKTHLCADLQGRQRGRSAVH